MARQWSDDKEPPVPGDPPTPGMSNRRCPPRCVPSRRVAADSAWPRATAARPGPLPAAGRSRPGSSGAARRGPRR
jgi:hypothetical protein